MHSNAADAAQFRSGHWQMATTHFDLHLQYSQGYIWKGTSGIPSSSWKTVWLLNHNMHGVIKFLIGKLDGNLFQCIYFLQIFSSHKKYIYGLSYSFLLRNQTNCINSDKYHILNWSFKKGKLLSVRWLKEMNTEFQTICKPKSWI